VPLLQTLEVTVRFGGVTALDTVNVDAESGRVTGLIGPNGAGKTTLFNVVTGLQSPTGGQVVIDGTEVTGMPVHRRARLGVARTFQRLEIFGSLTVRENIQVAGEIRRRWGRQRFDVDEQTGAILELIGLDRVADAAANTLPTGLARLTELGRALATQPRLLLLDEPGSGLDSSESEAFGRLLGDLAAEGLAVLLVEHDMDLIMDVCGWIHVLDFGVHLAQGTPDQIRRDPRVQEAYLGADPEGAADTAELRVPDGLGPGSDHGERTNVADPTAPAEVRR
jgi:branched-chain amino acid transport system ATP-binding protein